VPPAVGDAPFVAVVVPTHDRPDSLRTCLAGLVAQDYPPERYEIVVVDDGSTAVVADSGLVDACSVRVIRQPHRGVSAARNAGMTAASPSAELVCMVDDDVDVPPGWLTAVTRGAARHPNADAFVGPVRAAHGAGRACTLHPIVSTLEAGSEDQRIEMGLGANMALRRRAFEKAGPFDEWILIGGADTEWFHRLDDAGGRTIYVAGAGVEHHRADERRSIAALLGAEFRRGAAGHRFLLRRGADPSLWRGHLRPVPRLLRHAVRHRCLGALAQAARSCGFAYGLRRHRHLTPPVAPTVQR